MLACYSSTAVRQQKRRDRLYVCMYVSMYVSMLLSMYTCNSDKRVIETNTAMATFYSKYLDMRICLYLFKSYVSAKTSIRARTQKMGPAYVHAHICTPMTIG